MHISPGRFRAAAQRTRNTCRFCRARRSTNMTVEGCALLHTDENINVRGNKDSRSKGWCVCAERSRIFWKNLNAKAATELLSKKPSGSYLLRRSDHPQYAYALSEKTPSSTIHIRIGWNETTRLYNMDGFPASSQVGFTCVINLIESWSRVHKEFGLRSMQRAVHVTTPTDGASYVNVETGSVCFHDDKEAEEKVRRFVQTFFKRQSLR